MDRSEYRIIVNEGFPGLGVSLRSAMDVDGEGCPPYQLSTLSTTMHPNQLPSPSTTDHIQFLFNRLLTLSTFESFDYGRLKAKNVIKGLLVEATAPLTAAADGGVLEKGEGSQAWDR